VTPKAVFATGRRCSSPRVHLAESQLEQVSKSLQHLRVLRWKVEDFLSLHPHRRPGAKKQRGTSAFRSSLLCALLAVAISLWAGCNEAKQDDTIAPVERFPLRGEVTLLLPDMQRIVVRHDAIEGLRDASNFEFPVRDSKDMEGLSVGEEIRAVVFVQGRKYWLGEIEVVSTQNGDRR